MGGTGDQLYSLVETSDEAFALAGYKTSTYPNPPDLRLIKTEKYDNIQEFPSWAIMPLVLIATFAVLFRKEYITMNNEF